MSLTVSQISKSYGKQKALDNVSFTVNTGEIVGFLGPNGAGKSTMMKIITGFLAKDSGKVTINGYHTDTQNIEAKMKTGYLPEHNPLYLDMYVKEYLRFRAKLFKNNTNLNNKIKDIIEITGLTSEQNKKIKELSKGYRQRTGLAAALIHNPDVLILDEPTTGLDPNQILEMRNLISKVGKEKTVLLSTHIMQEVEAVCDRVIIINNGTLVADNPVNKIQELSPDNTNTTIVEFNISVEKNTLETINGLTNCVNINENTWALEADKETDLRPLIFNFAVQNNLIVLSMQKKEKNIEDIFRELTNNKQS